MFQQIVNFAVKKIQSISTDFISKTLKQVQELMLSSNKASKKKKR